MGTCCPQGQPPTPPPAAAHGDRHSPPPPRRAAQGPVRPHISNNTIRCLTVFPGKPARFFRTPREDRSKSLPLTHPLIISMARSGPRSITKKRGGPLWRAGQGLSGLNSGTENPASEGENHDEEALLIYILYSNIVPNPNVQLPYTSYLTKLWDIYKLVK